MDLRNLSSTPNQLDSVMQRRPSLSSLSSTSGYTSSSYGGATGGGGGNNGVNGNSTPQLSNQRLANQSRAFALNQNNSNTNLSGSWLQAQNTNQSTNSSQPSNQVLPGVGNYPPKQHNPVVNNVGPWVEQQQKQQQIDTTAIESNLNKPLKSGLSNNANTIPGPSESIHSNNPNKLPSNTNRMTSNPNVRLPNLGMNSNPNNDMSQHQQSTNPSSAAAISNANSMNPAASSTTSSNVNPNASMTSTNADVDDADDDTHDHDHDDDDELIPTAIVIKNIPFAIKKEQLLDVMTKLSLPLPYAFNYHFDNGVFRGLAFANFTSTDETSLVVNQLNGREIGGRKLRVEYKKMLPIQERERIEREKREKRGQLEEQHRSTSTASLASLLSTASTTAATKNMSINGNPSNSQTERLFISFPFTNLNVTLPPSELNFNDPEVLELYSQLITYRDDNSKAVFELAFPANLHLSHRKILSILCSYLSLLELFDNGLIIVRRKPGQQSIQQRHQQNVNLGPHQFHQQHHHHPHQQPTGSAQHMGGTVSGQGTGPNGQPIPPPGPLHSNSMMNLNQLSALVSNQNVGLPNGNQPHPPELLRSQSQSALPLPRLRQQTSTPVQQQFPQYQQSQQSNTVQPQQQAQTASQLAAFQASISQGPNARSYPQVQSFNQYQQGGAPSSAPSGQSIQPQSIGTPTTSAAALLRTSNNRSFVDVRSTPPLANSFSQNSQSVADSPTPQHSHTAASTAPSSHHQPAQPSGLQQGIHQHPFFSNNHSSTHLSQPSTPLGNNDLNSRFAPFGQHAHLTGSFTSLQQPSSTTTDDFPGGLNDTISSKFSGLNLGGPSFDGSAANGQPTSSNSGIWGPK